MQPMGKLPVGGNRDMRTAPVPGGPGTVAGGRGGRPAKCGIKRVQ